MYDLAAIAVLVAAFALGPSSAPKTIESVMITSTTTHPINPSLATA